jgi:hypothetical protein
MNKKDLRMKPNEVVILCLLLLMTSCAELAKEATSWTDIEDEDAVPGQYHFLESDGTKIFLPMQFERYSISAMQKVMDSLMDGDAYNYEVKRLNQLKDAKGELYVFYDKDSGSSCMISTIEYMPLSKDEAQQFLGFMRFNSDKKFGDSGIDFERLSAVYSGEPKKYIFKAVFRLAEVKNNTEWYHSSYIVTSNLKTIYVQLVTGFEVDFDPYITKTIL